MQWLSTDPDRPGVFAVGQVATGVFALGQLATGVIAVGQVARGVIAIGQGAVGFVAIGQGAVGILYGGAMLGIAGRGFGGVLRVLPKVLLEKFERPRLPPLTSLERFGSEERGWLLAEIAEQGLRVNGAELSVELEDSAREQLQQARDAGHNYVCLTIHAQTRVREERSGAYREAVERDRVLVAKRLTSWFEGQPRVRLEGPLTSLGGLLLRAFGMLGLAVVWYVLAGAHIVAMFQ